MEVSVEHLGSVQFEIKARQHTIECDQPPGNGGYDEGMTPPELLLASLGSCTGFYAVSISRNTCSRPKVPAFTLAPKRLRLRHAWRTSASRWRFLPSSATITKEASKEPSIIA
jgi:hypothetical protein